MVVILIISVYVCIFAFRKPRCLILSIEDVTMKIVLLQFLQDHFYLTALVIFLCFLAIIVSMVIDLIAGVQKAKQLGIARTSTGYKKTCAKAVKYFSPFAVAVCVDIITCIIVPIPVFSMMWTCWVGFCEFTSVREKAWEKEEIRKQNRTMQVILENKDDIAKAVVEILKNHKIEGNGDND